MSIRPSNHPSAQSSASLSQSWSRYPTPPMTRPAREPWRSRDEAVAARREARFGLGVGSLAAGAAMLGALLTLLGASGCADEGEALDVDGDTMMVGFGMDGAGETDGDEGDEGADWMGEDEGGSTDGADSGEEDGGGAALEPCTGVDLLFVIDNSDTMAEEQGKLLAAAGGFVDDIAKLVPEDVTFQVGAVTTDSADLVRSPGGVACNFFAESGLPFISHAGGMNAALDAGLSCALAVGTAGSPDERPMEMALTALGPAANVVGGPEPGANMGFVRDDAALVVVVLTDEEDDLETVTAWGSAGNPDSWADELSTIVEGVDDRVSVLSLVGHAKPNACPGFQWDGKEGAELAPRLIEFTQRFTHGMVGDACATSYGDFFAEAAFAVAGACGV